MFIKFRKLFCFLLFAILFAIWKAPAFAYEYVVSIPDYVSNFPIQPALVGSPQNAVDCYPNEPFIIKNNQSLEWMVSQWKNEQTLCKSFINEQSCPKADWNIHTTTEKFCYWKDQKKINIGTNALSMSNKGCLPNLGEPNSLYPGGYATYLTWNPKFRPDATAPYFYIKNLRELRLEANISTDFFTRESCPPGVLDPFIKSTDNFGMVYLSIVLTEMEPKPNTNRTVIFYQVVVVDNGDINTFGKRAYKECSFASVGGLNNIVISEPVVNLGAPMARIGGNMVSYDINVLPEIKKHLNFCYNKEVDLSSYKITAMYIGTEVQNAASIHFTAYNPRLRLITVPSISSKNLPTGYFEKSANQVCTISGWTCDKDKFDQPLNIKFYDYNNKLLGETAANLGRESAVGQQCGGNVNHGFYYKFKADSGFYDGQKHGVKVLASDIDPGGNQTGGVSNLTVIGLQEINCGQTPSRDGQSCCPKDKPEAGCPVCRGLNDLINIAGKWGTAASEADLNGDGNVNLGDLFVVAQNWKS